MNDTVATDSQELQNKRVRFDMNAVIPSGTKALAQNTPKSISLAFISTHVESLQLPIATILTKIARDHLDILHKLHHKLSQSTRMESDDDFIPQSARLEFTLNVSKKATEDPKFLTLKENTDIAVAEFRKVLRNSIIEATKIECDIIVDELHRNFVKSTFLIATASQLGEGIDNANIHAILSIIFTANNESLLKHRDLELNDYAEIYKEDQAILTFPLQTQASNNSTATTLSPFFAGAGTVRGQPDPDPPPLTRGTDSINRLIECILVTPFDRYLEQVKKNKIALSLKKLNLTHYGEKSTADADMRVNDEDAASREQLRELVRKENRSENNKLQNELDRLKKQMKQLTNAKNGQRGHSPTGGASTKRNPKSTPRTRKNSEKKAPAQKAAASDKDSNSGRNARNRKGGKQKTGKSSRGSSTGSRK